MGTCSFIFILYLETECIYVYIAKYFEARVDISNHELGRPILREKKTKKVIGLMIVELGGKIMTEFALSRPKTDSYLTHGNDENKKSRCTKKCVTKQKLKFKDSTNFLEANQLKREINHRSKIKLDVGSLREKHKGFIKAID